MEQEHDQPESQYHTLFRQYDAVLGRWWSIDPEQERYASFSPYTAMGANPVNFVDPWGREYEGTDGEPIIFDYDYNDKDEITKVSIVSDNATPEVEFAVELLNNNPNPLVNNAFEETADNDTKNHLEFSFDNIGKFAVHEPHGEDGKKLNYISSENRFSSMPAYIFDENGDPIGYKEATFTFYVNNMMKPQLRYSYLKELIQRDDLDFTFSQFFGKTFTHETDHNTNKDAIQFIHRIRTDKDFNPSKREFDINVEYPAYEKEIEAIKYYMKVNKNE